MGVLIGTFVGGVVQHFYPLIALESSSNYLMYAFLLSAGALLGDLAGSFIKRRMGMNRGQAAHFLDQLDFVMGGLLLSLFVNPPYWTVFLILIMITPFMHMAFNRLAYLLGLKSVPW